MSGRSPFRPCVSPTRYESEGGVRVVPRSALGLERQARRSASDDDAKSFQEAVDVVGTAIGCEPESDAAVFAESEPS